MKRHLVFIVCFCTLGSAFYEARGARKPNVGIFFADGHDLRISVEWEAGRPGVG